MREKLLREKFTTEEKKFLSRKEIGNLESSKRKETTCLEKGKCSLGGGGNPQSSKGGGLGLMRKRNSYFNTRGDSQRRNYLLSLSRGCRGKKKGGESKKKVGRNNSSLEKNSSLGFESSAPEEEGGFGWGRETHISTEAIATRRKNFK